VEAKNIGSPWNKRGWLEKPFREWKRLGLETGENVPSGGNRQQGVGSLTRESVNTLLWVCGAMVDSKSPLIRERPNASNTRLGKSIKAAGKDSWKHGEMHVT